MGGRKVGGRRDGREGEEERRGVGDREEGGNAGWEGREGWKEGGRMEDLG